jgi:hypothetical protein
MDLITLLLHIDMVEFQLLALEHDDIRNEMWLANGGQ